MTPVSNADFDALQGALADGRADAGAMAATLLAQHPDPVSQGLLTGLMALAQGKAPQAYAAFLQASTIAPDTARAYLGLGQALFQLGHADKAIAASLQALRLDPANWNAALVIADSSAAMGRWSDAIAQYQAVLSTGAQSVFAHLGLGAALVQARRLAEAKDQFAQVIRLRPNHAVGYCNLGYTLMTLGEYHEAIRLLLHALTLEGDAPGMIHTNLADAYFSIGDFAAAEAQSRQAVALVPEFAPAHGIRAEALRALGRHGEAIPHYRAHGTAEANAKALESLYHLGDMDAFAAAQSELAQSQPDNIRLAAIGADAAARHGARYASRFCADPLAAIAISNLKPKLEPFETFGEDLLREAVALDAVWEPPRKTTKGGYQTEGNIFDLGTPAITRLKSVLGEAISDYFAQRAGSSDRFVTHWPKHMNLTGWVVRLRQSGRQDMHIHPDGWLSGVLYLKLPRLGTSEGGIGFSVSGRASEPPGRVHQPQAGELVLFPSSLFHFTVPFSADEERISVAFDLLPK